MAVQRWSSSCDCKSQYRGVGGGDVCGEVWETLCIWHLGGLSFRALVIERGVGFGRFRVLGSLGVGGLVGGFRV